ncbi:MAG: S8 family serine peptidase [Actinomycetaceae bacterium]
MSRRLAVVLAAGAALALAGPSAAAGATGPAPGATTVRLELPDSCVVEPEPTEPSPIFDQVGFERAHELTRGEGVTVAVVDSGVLPASEHFGEGEDVVLPGHDSMGTLPGSESQTEGPPLSSSDGRTDVHFHGTAAAGLIASRAVEGSGVLGVAPAAQILPVRVYAVDRDHDLAEQGYGPEVGRMAEGIRWAADQGAQIISVSMSLTVDDPALREAVEHATAAGSLVVASAGNADTTEDTSDSARYPGAYPEALAVTASTIEGLPSESSIHGEHVDIAAPGDVAYYPFLDDGPCYLTGNPSSSWSTAYVAGAAALVAAEHPDETPAQWKYRLTSTAVRANPQERDDLLGWGIVAPYDAVTFVDDGSAPGPPSPVHEAPTADAASFVPVPARPPDPLDAVRGEAAWWVFGAFVVVGGAGLLAKAPRRRG